MLVHLLAKFYIYKKTGLQSQKNIIASSISHVKMYIDKAYYYADILIVCQKTKRNPSWSQSHLARQTHSLAKILFPQYNLFLLLSISKFQGMLSLILQIANDVNLFELQSKSFHQIRNDLDLVSWTQLLQVCKVSWPIFLFIWWDLMAKFKILILKDVLKINDISIFFLWRANFY